MVYGRPQGCKQGGFGDRQVEETRQITIRKSVLDSKKKWVKNRKHTESCPYIIRITGVEMDLWVQNSENTALVPLGGQILSSPERGEGRGPESETWAFSILHPLGRVALHFPSAC